MSKNIKRVIAIAMAIGIISAVAPSADMNFLSTKAYASSTNDTDKLESLKLETSDGSNIKLYSDSSYKDKVNSDEVTDKDNYFAKTPDSTVSISVRGPRSQYVRVFKGTSKSTKGKKVSNDISLASGSNTLTVRVYSEEPDSNVTYDDDSYVSEYKIKVKCTASDSSSNSSSSSSDSNADSYDSIYLDKLSVDGTSIDLSDSKVKYTYNVSSDTDSVTIKAVPDDEDTDTVEIDGNEVDSSDKYRKTVDLDKGENKFKIELTNEDDEERVYTLIINRGATSSSTSNSSTTTTATSKPSTAADITPAKVSQWVKVNGRWQYNDATGNPVRNSWVSNYYLQADANMATGWLNYSGNLYYLGTDGAKKTGWQLVDGAWYYLDTAEGRMQTGWMKDIDGKYYYLNGNGKMAYNTTIDGYRLGASGAWIGR